jgi:hypothetical protein
MQKLINAFVASKESKDLSLTSTDAKAKWLLATDPKWMQELAGKVVTVARLKILAKLKTKQVKK